MDNGLILLINLPSMSPAGSLGILSDIPPLGEFYRPGIENHSCLMCNYIDEGHLEA